MSGLRDMLSDMVWGKVREYNGIYKYEFYMVKRLPAARPRDVAFWGYKTAVELRGIKPTEIKCTE